jgi:hypothetical protein
LTRIATMAAFIFRKTIWLKKYGIGL